MSKPPPHEIADAPIQRLHGARQRRLLHRVSPELPGCHTQARPHDELMLRIREAIELCLEVEGDDPEVGQVEFIGAQRITIES